jgi:DNA-binding LacI/PurR family transcriptional regulator
VLSAAKILNFVPNKAAQCLATKHGVTFHLVFGEHAGEPTPEIMAGALAECSDRNALLLVRDERNALAWAHSFSQRGPAGVILCGLQSATIEIARLLNAADIAVVAIDRTHPFPELDTVYGDQRDAITTLVRHLLGKRHQQFLFLKSTNEPDEGQLREAIFHSAVRALAKDHFHVDVREVSDFIGIIRVIQEVLSAPDPPSAIVGATDMLAATAMTLTYGLNLRARDQVAFCGLGSELRSRAFWPHLTTTCLPAAQLGRAAIDCLARRLEAKQRNEELVVQARSLPYTLNLPATPKSAARLRRSQR